MKASLTMFWFKIIYKTTIKPKILTTIFCLVRDMNNQLNGVTITVEFIVLHSIETYEYNV